MGQRSTTIANPVSNENIEIPCVNKSVRIVIDLDINDGRLIYSDMEITDTSSIINDDIKRNTDFTLEEILNKEDIDRLISDFFKIRFQPPTRLMNSCSLCKSILSDIKFICGHSICSDCLQQIYSLSQSCFGCRLSINNFLGTIPKINYDSKDIKEISNKTHLYPFSENIKNLWKGDGFCFEEIKNYDIRFPKETKIFTVDNINFRSIVEIYLDFMNNEAKHKCESCLENCIKLATDFILNNSSHLYLLRMFTDIYYEMMSGLIIYVKNDGIYSLGISRTYTDALKGTNSYISASQMVDKNVYSRLYNINFLNICNNAYKSDITGEKLRINASVEEMSYIELSHIHYKIFEMINIRSQKADLEIKEIVKFWGNRFQSYKEKHSAITNLFMDLSLQTIFEDSAIKYRPTDTNNTSSKDYYNLAKIFGVQRDSSGWIILSKIRKQLSS